MRRVAAAAALIAVTSGAWAAERVGDVLARTGLDAPALAGLPVLRSLRRPGKSHVFWSVTSETERQRLRLEITTGLDAEAAERMVEQRSVVIRSIFKPYHTEYLGALKARAEVPAELHPRVLRPRPAGGGPTYPFFILWSAREFDYAVRSRADAAFRGTLAFLYCPDAKVLYQIERAEPASGFDEKRAVAGFLSLRCSAPAGPSR